MRYESKSDENADDTVTLATALPTVCDLTSHNPTKFIAELVRVWPELNVGGVAIKEPCPRLVGLDLNRNCGYLASSIAGPPFVCRWA